MSQQALQRGQDWGSRRSLVHSTASFRYQTVPGYSGLARSARAASAYQSAGSDNYRGSAAPALRSDHSQGSAPTADMQLAVRHGTPAPTEASLHKTISDVWHFENVRYLLNEARMNLNNGTLLHAFSEENARALGPWGMQVHDRLALRLQELAAITAQMQHNAVLDIGPCAQETEFWEKFTKQHPQQSTSKTSLNAELKRLEKDLALQHASFNAQQNEDMGMDKKKRSNRGQGKGKEPIIKAEETKLSLTTIPPRNHHMSATSEPQFGYQGEEAKAKSDITGTPGRGDAVHATLSTPSSRKHSRPPPLKLENRAPRYEITQHGNNVRSEYGHNVQHRNSYANRGQLSNYHAHASNGRHQAINVNAHAGGSRAHPTNQDHTYPSSGYGQTLNNGYAYANNNYGQAWNNMYTYAGRDDGQVLPSGYAHFFGGSRPGFSSGFAHIGDAGYSHPGGSIARSNSGYGYAHAGNSYGQIVSGQVVQSPPAHNSNVVIRGPRYRIAYVTRPSTNQSPNQSPNVVIRGPSYRIAYATKPSKGPQLDPDHPAKK